MSATPEIGSVRDGTDALSAPPPDLSRSLPPASRLANLARWVTARHGGVLLATRWLGTAVKHRFACAHGHAFDATPGNVVHRRSWCPHCAGNARLTPKRVAQLACEHGCELVDGQRIANRHDDVRLRCLDRGHEFSINLQNVASRARARWCGECARIEEAERLHAEAIELARRAGYVLLGERWEGERTPLRYRCPVGHLWSCRLSNFRAGRRCGACWRGEAVARAMAPPAGNAGERATPARVVDESTDRIAPPNGNSPAANAHRGGGAPCALPVPPPQSWRYLTETERLANLDDWVLGRYRGELLSTHLGSAATRHRLRCRHGHEFAATVSNLRHRGSWCPTCARNAATIVEDVGALLRAHGCEPARPGPTRRAAGPMKVRCLARGHVFTVDLARAPDRRRRDWCQRCFRIDEDARSLSLVRAIARHAGYALLTDAWPGYAHKLDLRCPTGHLWSVRADHLIEGQRCGHCWREPRHRRRRAPGVPGGTSGAATKAGRTDGAADTS